jgi:hypothetical protein
MHLLSEVYHIPPLEISFDQAWDADSVAKLGPCWVSKQHFFPSQALMDAIVRENIVVISTVRHPGDALVSYVNYIKWWRGGDDAEQNRLLVQDAGEYKQPFFEFLERHYQRIYGISLLWRELGAHVIRYEDMLENPLSTLEQLCSRFAPVHRDNYVRALVLCMPRHMAKKVKLDARFIHKARSRQWPEILPSNAIKFLQQRPPFVAATTQLGYDWSAQPQPEPFDYTSIDPFGSAACFDNGAEITAYLKELYFDQYPYKHDGIPPWTTENPRSFWRWLQEPYWQADQPCGPHAALINNLLWCIYQDRDDLRSSFPRLDEDDSLGLAHWFCSHGASELTIPWELTELTNKALLASLTARAAKSPSNEARAALRNASLRIGGEELGFFGASVTAPAGTSLMATMEYSLSSPVRKPILGITLRRPNGFIVFGSNSLFQDIPICTDSSGTVLKAGITCQLTLPQGTYKLCIGLADQAEDGSIVPLLRCYDLCSIEVTNHKTMGTAFCTTSFQSGQESC